MSAEHAAWAARVPVANKSQRLALNHLAYLAEDDGTIKAASNAIQGLDGINTPAGANRVLQALQGAGHLTKQWDPDKYVWVYRLHGLR